MRLPFLSVTVMPRFTRSTPPPAAATSVPAGHRRQMHPYPNAAGTPSPCLISEATGPRSLKKILAAARAAGGTLVSVPGRGPAAPARRSDELRAEFPDV